MAPPASRASPPTTCWPGSTSAISSRAARCPVGAAGSLFERLFGTPASHRPPRGADIATPLTVPLTTLLAGAEHTATIRRPGPCTSCHGTGAAPGSAPRECDRCHGLGQETSEHRKRQVAECPACSGRGTVIDRPCPECDATGEVEHTESITLRRPNPRRRHPDRRTARHPAGHGHPHTGPGRAGKNAVTLGRPRARASERATTAHVSTAARRRTVRRVAAQPRSGPQLLPWQNDHGGQRRRQWRSVVARSARVTGGT
ncbi:zinc finger domain-containing protein [Kitasatospora sp. NPDC001603]|uniref:zinc finger domain-containing protein n=1 Tax=Kitasatospora sp. NPDC001603 TaxID=3154388 RepID=UPI00332689AA